MNKKNVAKMLLVFVMVLAMFGSTVTVFAAGSLDLVGNGTGTSTTVTGGSQSTSTSTTSGSQTTTSTTTTTSGSVTAGTSTTPSTTTTTTPSTTTATTTTTAPVVQTGNMEKSIPFAAAMAAAVLMVVLFVHLQLNQTRIGKSEKYYKEMEDFRFMCRN